MFGRYELDMCGWVGGGGGRRRRNVCNFLVYAGMSLTCPMGFVSVDMWECLNDGTENSII